MHADLQSYIKRYHEGQLPPSWLRGDLDFQKAKVIAALAHHFTKDETDPELPACDLTFQESCTGIVEGIMRGANPLPTDPPFYHVAHDLFTQTLITKETP